jgi:hypothetical protein
MGRLPCKCFRGVCMRLPPRSTTESVRRGLTPASFRTGCAQVRPWARRRGVAEFEKFAADKELGAPFDGVTRLYQVCARARGH